MRDKSSMFQLAIAKVQTCILGKSACQGYIPTSSIFSNFSLIMKTKKKPTTTTMFENIPKQIFRIGEPETTKKYMKVENSAKDSSI